MSKLASGRTVLLDVMTAFFPANDRVIIIENTKEIDVQPKRILKKANPKKFKRYN